MADAWGEGTVGVQSNRRPSGPPALLMGVPAPSPIAGMEPLTRRTFRRLGWLTVRNAPANPVIMAVTGVVVGCLAIGSALNASMAGAAHPIVVGAFAAPVGLVVFVVIVLLLQEVVIRRWKRAGGWVVGYFTANSCQLVHPDDDAWVLSDHHTAHRGRGEAGPFRRQVFAHLAAEADLYQVTIRFDTQVRRLADSYLQEMPGLELTGIRRQRFATLYLLQRVPRPGPRRRESPERSGDEGSAVS